MSGWQRLRQLPQQLNRRERRLALGLLVLLAAVGVWQFAAWRQRQSAPAYGGTFVEGIVGQPQLLNPLVSMDAGDRAVLSLIYPGLTHTDASGQTTTVLAESWEMQDNGQKWTFILKAGLKWHNGDALTTSDIADTITRVIDPQQKSPYISEWDTVTVEVVDERKVIFHLPQANAAFLTATDLPIVPLGQTAAELSQKLIGSGPFRYVRSTTAEGRVVSIELESNADWPGGRPYLKTWEFRYFGSDSEAEKAYQAGDVTGLLRTDAASSLPGNEHLFSIQRTRAIFANTQRDALKDEAARVRLLQGEKITDQSLTLILPEGLATYEPLRALIEKWQSAGQPVTVTPLSSVALLDRLDNHDYDLLVAEVDLQADFDLYPLWHSTQQADGLNLALLDDAQVDSWLEQARATADASARHALADQINERATALGAWRQFEQVQRRYNVQSFVRGVDIPDKLVETNDRLAGAAGWYVRTKASAN